MTQHVKAMINRRFDIVIGGHLSKKDRRITTGPIEEFLEKSTSFYLCSLGALLDDVEYNSQID